MAFKISMKAIIKLILRVVGGFFLTGGVRTIHPAGPTATQINPGAVATALATTLLKQLLIDAAINAAVKVFYNPNKGSFKNLSANTTLNSNASNSAIQNFLDSSAANSQMSTVRSRVQLLDERISIVYDIAERASGRQEGEIENQYHYGPEDITLYNQLNKQNFGNSAPNTNPLLYPLQANAIFANMSLYISGLYSNLNLNTISPATALTTINLFIGQANNIITTTNNAIVSIRTKNEASVQVNLLVSAAYSNTAADRTYINLVTNTAARTTIDSTVKAIYVGTRNKSNGIPTNSDITANVNGLYAGANVTPL